MAAPGELDLGQALLLGGTNRDLAADLGRALAPALPEYAIVTDLEQIPARLRGLHRANPVNAARGWRRAARAAARACAASGMKWRHLGPGVRPPETGRLVEALARVASSYR